MRRARNRTWELVQRPDGRCEVARGGRQVLVDVSEAEARKRIKKKMAPGDQVVLVEEDGYRSLLNL